MQSTRVANAPVAMVVAARFPTDCAGSAEVASSRRRCSYSVRKASSASARAASTVSAARSRHRLGSGKDPPSWSTAREKTQPGDARCSLSGALRALRRSRHVRCRRSASRKSSARVRICEMVSVAKHRMWGRGFVFYLTGGPVCRLSLLCRFRDVADVYSITILAALCELLY